MELIPIVNDDLELTHFEGKRSLKGLSNNFIVVEDNDLFYITETINRGIDEVYKQTYKIDKELIKTLNDLWG